MALFWSKSSDHCKTAFQWTMENHGIEISAIINVDYGGDPHKIQTYIQISIITTTDYFQQSPNYSYSFCFCTFPQSVILGKPGWLFYKHNLDHVVCLLKLFQWRSNVLKIKTTFLTMAHKTLHEPTSYLSSFDQPSILTAFELHPPFLLFQHVKSVLYLHWSSLQPHVVLPTSPLPLSLNSNVLSSETFPGYPI